MSAFNVRAVWVGYPAASTIRAWTPTVDADHAHVVAEGLA